MLYKILLSIILSKLLIKEEESDTIDDDSTSLATTNNDDVSIRELLSTVVANQQIMLKEMSSLRERQELILTHLFTEPRTMELRMPKD